MSTSHPVVVLLVGIGNVPAELVSAAEQILGTLDGVRAVCFQPTRKADVVYERIRRNVERIDQGGGVLIVADLCGSTLANAAYRLVGERSNCEVLCGANLPMLMKLYSMDRTCIDAQELGEELADTGRRGINLCTEKRCGAEAMRRTLEEPEEK